VRDCSEANAIKSLTNKNKEKLAAIHTFKIDKVYYYSRHNDRVVKAKFHYAIQVADLVSDLSQTVSSYFDMSR